MGFRLLLVHNDIQTAKTFKEAAPAVGAQLISIESAELAARRVRDERFDLIFIDTVLPQFSRQTFTSLVRKSKFNSLAPIILLTGYQGGGNASFGITDGVSRMVKPSTTRELLPFLQEFKRKLYADRRKNRRLSFRVTVQCLQGGRRFRATSINLSAQGMLLEASWPVERGADLEVHLLLNENEPPFQARVRVVRLSDKGQVGVVFQSLGTIERQRLRQFLDLHLPPAC